MSITRIVRVIDALILALLIGCASIVLSGGFVFTIGSTPVSMRDPWRPAVAVLVLVATRILLWSRRRGQVPAVVSFADRTRFLETPARPPRLGWYVLGVAVLTLVPLWPHLAEPAAVSDPGDPFFSAWRLAWIAHQLVTSPLHLFDANIFHPASLTLTYSDAIPVAATVGVPLIWLGLDPIVAANLAFLLAFPLCAVAFFYVAWHLTRHAQAAFVAGLMGGLLPFHFEHYSHLELQFFFWIPLAMLAAIRLVAAPSVRRGVVLGLCVAAQWYSSLYFGVMLTTYLVPFVAIVAVGWRRRPDRVLLGAGAAAAGVLALTVTPLLVPYLASRDARGERDLVAVEYYSATPGDYFRASPQSRLYGERPPDGRQAERQLFPGVTPLALAFVALPPPVSGAAFATLVAGALAADASLGVNGISYPWLYDWAPPYRGMRVPARFAVFVGTSLILLSAWGTTRLLGLRRPVLRAAIFVTLVAAVLVDMWPALELRRYWVVRPPIYDHVTSDMVLAEFPMTDGPAFAYQYFSTFHWARLVNGHSGFMPPWYLELQESMAEFPSDATLARLRALGTTHVTLTCDFYGRRSRCQDAIATLDARPDVSLVSGGEWAEHEVRLYELLPAP